MNLDETLALYDAEVRAKPVARSGLAVERTGGVVRLTGLFNFVSSWDQQADIAQMVAAQAGYFRARGEALMWRVHDHDGPAGLAACLAANPASTSRVMKPKLRRWPWPMKRTPCGSRS